MTMISDNAKTYFSRQFIDNLHAAAPTVSDSTFSMRGQGVSHIDAANSRAKDLLKKHLDLEAMRKFKEDSIKLRADIVRIRSQKK